MGRQQILVWPIVVTCCVVIFLNYLYRWPLYYKGIEIIRSMQADENVVFDWFFLIVTMIIDPTVVFGLCMLMMVLSHKKGQGFIMLIFILLNTFCAAVLKAYDCDPRPFWTEANVRNIGFYCPVQYGNPSGHSWFSAVFGFGILLDYWGSGPYYLFIWISIASVILMPISRMYLGAHSLNQVLEGLCLGLAMCLLYVIKLRSLIKSYLKQFNKDNNWKLVIAICHVIYWIPFIAHRKEQLPAEWEKNILDKCSVVMNEGKLNSLMFVVNALLVNVATGIGLGYQILSKSKMGENYLKGKWQINEQMYELSRGYVYFVLVECICLLSGLLVGALIYLLVPHIVVAYVALSLGGLVSGYVYTVKTCHLLQKWKIIIQTEPDTDKLVQKK